MAAPIRNVDQFVKTVETLLKSSASDAEKKEQLPLLISTAGEIFKTYQAASRTEQLRDLADRMKPLSPEHADALTALADAIFFPPELTQLILGALPTDLRKTGSVRLSCKAMRRQLFELAGPLHEMNVKTAQDAIEFAKRFGEHLTSLDISKINFQASELLRLLRLPITKLVARGCQLQKEELQVIATRAPFRLTQLDLGQDPYITKDFLSQEGLIAIFTSKNLSQLTHLNLQGISLKPPIKIFEAIALPELRELNLSHNKWLTDRELSALTKAPFSKLNALNLHRCSVTGVQAIIKLPKLKWLDMSYCDIDEENLRILTEWEERNEATLVLDTFLATTRICMLMEELFGDPNR